MIHFIYLFLYFRFEWIYICPSSKPGRVPNKTGLGLCTKHLKSPWARNRVHQNRKSWKLLFLVFTHMILACDLPSISVAGQVHGSHGSHGPMVPWSLGFTNSHHHQMWGRGSCCTSQLLWNFPKMVPSWAKLEYIFWIKVYF